MIPSSTPVWDAAARLKLPVFIHTADPQEFWQPIDYNNERWLELALFPGRRYPSEQFPAFETLMTERDNLVRRNPRTTFVIAHLGWHANDLGRLSKMMDEMPNLYSEVGAVLYDIGRQPRAAHDFFVKYQDRILFGKDSFQPEEYPYYWRVFETRDDYFDYYRDYHASWKLYGIDLPDAVLKKVYFGNALRITAGFRRPAGRADRAFAVAYATRDTCGRAQDVFVIVAFMVAASSETGYGVNGSVAGPTTFLPSMPNSDL